MCHIFFPLPYCNVSLIASQLHDKCWKVYDFPFLFIPLHFKGQRCTFKLTSFIWILICRLYSIVFLIKQLQSPIQPYILSNWQQISLICPHTVYQTAHPPSYYLLHIQSSLCPFCLISIFPPTIWLLMGGAALFKCPLLRCLYCFLLLCWGFFLKCCFSFF